MLRIHCKFTTNKGTISAGVVSKKEVKKHFSESEIENYIEEGLISEIHIKEGLISEIHIEEDVSENKNTMTLDEMLDANKYGLKVAELREVCEHYKLPNSGKKDELIERIEHFETLLVLDIDEMEEEDVLKMAAYYEVDASLSLEEMKAAIEEVSA